MTMNLCLGMITPPVGVNTYVAAALGGKEARMEDLFMWLIPFFMAVVVEIVLLILFPKISLFLGGGAL
jgi:TRAP-type C4-dicarboxylate transport system permease large subunit